MAAHRPVPERRKMCYAYSMNDIKVFSNSLSPASICRVIVEDAERSPRYGEMRDAQAYFEGHNLTIEKKTRNFVDASGKTHANPVAANTRLSSSFLRNLIQQKQDYAFAKTFVFKLCTMDGEEVNVSDAEGLAKDYYDEWNALIREQLFRLSYKMTGNAVNKGITWCYVWIDQDGGFKLVEVEPEHVYPIWKDVAHSELTHLVNAYLVKEYENTSPTDHRYAEYWTGTERILFDVDGAFTPIYDIMDADGYPVTSHMLRDGAQVSWDRIPFIPFKGTDDEKPLLSFIRSYIDTYDMIASKASDGLQDDIDPLLIFKGISAEIQHLAEAREIAKSTRTMSLDPDGDAFYLQANANVKNNLDLMEALKKNIIKFGYGVDFEDNRFGGNPNQMVVKALYQNMDTYVDGLERHFQDFMEDLKYFFDKWFSWKHGTPVEQLEEYRLMVKLDRSMMINLTAQIDDTIKLQQTGISQRTILEFNPVVQDVDVEIARMRKEQEEQDAIFYRNNYPGMGEDSDTEVDIPRGPGRPAKDDGSLTTEK